jgi:putative addiction module component (TIGR02574 family)
MSMSTQAISESFRRLPPNERIRLLQELWDVVADDVAEMPLSEPIRRLLDERIQQHEENPTDVEPWEHTREEILREL